MIEDTNEIAPGIRRYTPKRGGRYYTFEAFASTDQGVESSPRFYSSTTFLGIIDKPALRYWVANTIAEKMVQMANDDAAYLMRRLQDDDAYQFVKGLPWANRDRAADLGTLIHDIAERVALDQPYEHLVTEPAEPYVTAFLKFWSEWEPTLVASEAPVVNVERRYAGTLDAIIDITHPEPGVDRRLRVLLDYKTGKGVYPEASLQLSSYAHAEHIYLPTEGIVPMLEVDAAAVLHLTPDGYEVVPVDISEDAFYDFLYARELYRWNTDRAPDAIGDPVTRAGLWLSDYVGSSQ